MPISVMLCVLLDCEGSQVWQQTPEEGWRMHQWKHEYNNKDEDNSPNMLNDKNHQASSKDKKKCRQIMT